MSKLTVNIKFKDNPTVITKIYNLTESEDITYSMTSGLNPNPNTLRNIKFIKAFKNLNDMTAQLQTNEFYLLWNALKDKDLKTIEDFSVSLSFDRGDDITYHKSNGVNNINYEISTAGVDAIFKYSVNLTIWS